MTREELEHIIRASAGVTDQYEFIIVGSQSILGAIPNPDAVFTASAEADIYPLLAPELADKIDGAIGEGSQFHAKNGYYAQGVGPDTAIRRKAGFSVCIEFRTPTPTIGSATAWTCQTCSCQRRRQVETRIASSAWPCSSTVTCGRTKPCS